MGLLGGKDALKSLYKVFDKVHHYESPGTFSTDSEALASAEAGKWYAGYCGFLPWAPARWC